MTTMKRFMTGFAACALIMTSCTKQEVSENVLDGQGQLSFSTGLGKQSTKAAELMNTSLKAAATGSSTGIALRAYQETTTSGVYEKWFIDDLWYATSEWKTGSTRFRNTVSTKYITYFPKSDRLDEVTDATETTKSTFETANFLAAPGGVFPAFTYTVAGNSAAQEDLIAGITDVAANQTDITLGLRHILSQVNFGTVGYNGAQISIQNIRIEGLYNSARYTYRAEDSYPVGDWSAFGTDGTAPDRTATYEYFNYSNGTAVNNPQPSVPATATKGDIYIFGDGGNAGPGRTTTTWYPLGADNAWDNAHVSQSTGLANSLMLIPQNFMTDAPDAKVTFEYKIRDVDSAYVAGSAAEWEKGEFKLNFETGAIPGTHYLGQWDQNYRYVYLIDFTDFLDGLALTFKVDVEMYPWENYNNGGDDNGIVNIMAAGQPSATDMNLIANTEIWYIASQDIKSPVTFDPQKWAQVIRNETWNLSAYDFTKIEKDQTFTLSFLNVIFNTTGTIPVATGIDLTLPAGYTAIAGTGITVTENTAPRYTVKQGNKTITAMITITNTNKEYSTPATLGAAVTAVTVDADALIYKGTEAIDLKTMEPTALTAIGNTITVKFNSTVVPTPGATANGGTWAWNAANKTATWTK